jgi:ATP:corrinoid adenosyltransferase
MMFLGGAGGTGNSRVIDAVDAFCTRWHRDDAIVKPALTGKAATMIGGRTLASFLMRPKHAIKDKHFAPLDLLVIDEISMMSKPEWLQLDKLLRSY